MSQSTVKKIPNNYFDGMPVTGFHSSTGRLAVAAAQPLIPMAYAAYSFDGVFWIFSFLCFVPAVVIAIWGQRTGGKSLEEIA